MLLRTFEELALLPNGSVNEAYRPLAISMYHLHVHRWLEVFSREQLLVVNGDQLIEDPLSQLKRIETFLGKFFNRRPTKKKKKRCRKTIYSLNKKVDVAKRQREEK